MDIFNNKNNNNEKDFEEGKIIDVQPIENKYIKSDTDVSKKRKKLKVHTGSGKRIVSYILVALICAALGGAASTALTLKYYNKANTNGSVTQNNLQSNTNQSTTGNTTASKTSSNVVPLSVANIAKKVGPAVVGVSTKSIKSVDMFGFPEQEEGMGSGIIFNEEGYVLTNYHVVSGAKQITVILNTGEDQGKQVNAKLVNYDADMDVAVIKITDKVTMPAVAEFGDSDALQIGDPAVAIGNPLGKEFLGTVTSGVISAVKREISIEDGQKQTYIQTDAAINPGNSGGALVNVYGQVIGINSAKIGGSQIEGIGFAIPINKVKPKIEHLLKPILKMGIVVRDIDEQNSKRYNVPVGVYVQQVEEFSPAEKAGLIAGDVITKFDGKSVKTISELNELKSKHNANDVVKVTVSRNGKTKTLNLTLTE